MSWSYSFLLQCNKCKQPKSMLGIWWICIWLSPQHFVIVPQVEQPITTSPNSARHIKCKMQKHLQQLEILNAIKYMLRYISFVASLGF
jgi:hypothetical protein